MHKLYIHIGAGKCGSTAIQHFLWRNVAKLAERGVLIPSAKLTHDGNEFGNQIWFFQHLLNMEPQDAQDIVHKRLKVLREYMGRNGLHTMVLSAENLSNPVGFETLFARCDDLFDVNIVLYIRRQDDFLLSAWQQWGVKISDSFDAWLLDDSYFQGRSLWADWHSYLQPWEKIFGQEKIVLRRFVKEKLIGGDVVKDFFASCGLPVDELSIGKPVANRSFNDTITRLAYDARDLFTGMHDNRLYDMFSRFGGPGIHKNRKGSSLISLEKRTEILNTYKEGNARLKQDYFSCEQGPLFSSPSEDDVYYMSEQQVVDEKIASLTRTLFGLYEHIIKMEKDASKP